MTKTLLQLAILVVFIACNRHSSSKSSIDKVINPSEVERIEKVLSSDEMQGRRAGTPAIDKAADFIAGEFKSAGLQYLDGLTSYRQEFMMIRAAFVSGNLKLNGETTDIANAVVVTQQPQLTVSSASGYKTEYVGPKDNFSMAVNRVARSNENMVLIIDTAHRKNFPRLARLRRPSFPSQASQVFILGDKDTRFEVSVKNDVSQLKYTNVVGVLPGKSKKEEFVVFSGHYDHLGIGKPTPEGDSIYNGANDDAAGTTAVMMLAKYFSKLKNNERTLMFVAFTAEEVGGYGSQYFSRQVNPDKVMAMFNIEMIGTESKWGRNAAYITGFDKSDMGKILQNNLQGSGFTFHPDPYPDQDLFYRSDNATLASLGVPAHTISTSQMDKEKYYHTADDEIGTLDMPNMAAIIRAIAISSKGIVAGTETPSRVKRN